MAKTDTSAPDERKKLEKILKENQRVVAENNELLKKLHRNAQWALWLRVAWYALLIGLPFVIYFYVIEPYFEAFGANFDVFSQGLREIPGWREFYEAFSEDVGS